ncbi:type II toxin-antitoxin system HicB family antitoxin [Avibacterium paragallinarum]|uniref:type II toxin-antitoxin system HicB family antitoxin n=1 Tax=Avibacterium paragallinarum TaxID=728 RepID=UPI00397D8ACA
MRNYPLNVWQEDGVYLATFADEKNWFGVTQAETEQELQSMANDLLITAVEMKMEFNQPIPEPTAIEPNQPIAQMPTLLCAKVMLHNEMIAQRITKAELARRMGILPQEVQRLLKPRCNTKIDTLDKAFQALNKHLVLTLN